MKMKESGTYTVKIQPISRVGCDLQVQNNPRWNKDGLSLAFKDSENSWNILDFEKVEIDSKEDCWYFNIVHNAEQFIKTHITLPIGIIRHTQQITVREESIDGNFYENSVSEVSYIDGFGTRTQQAGLVAEIIDPVGTACFLFVRKFNDFNGQWKLKDQKLHLFDNKGRAPAISPDGKYVAFVEQNSSSIIIQKIEDLPNESLKLLESNEMTDPESVLFDVKKLPPPKVQTKLTPLRTFIPTTIPTALHLSRETNNMMVDSHGFASFGHQLRG